MREAIGREFNGREVVGSEFERERERDVVYNGQQKSDQRVNAYTKLHFAHLPHFKIFIIYLFLRLKITTSFFHSFSHKPHFVTWVIFSLYIKS